MQRMDRTGNVLGVVVANLDGVRPLNVDGVRLPLLYRWISNLQLEVRAKITDADIIERGALDA